MNYQEIAEELVSFAQAGIGFVYWFALACGICLTFMALTTIVKKGNAGGFNTEPRAGWGAIAGRLLIASALATLATKLEAVIGTNGSVDGARTVLAYAQGQSSQSAVARAIWAAICTWCVFIATIGFFRGFLLLDKASQGMQDSHDAFWRALWHIIFSALAIQIFS
ncbi:MAG: hypothetical protein V4731_03990 [Pseudomonadota bacterium]